ncbi:MAG TPA: hypothetical protein VGD37_39565 [Kofleriaceae bacterium]|jgi:hypothetical protein
MSNQELQTIDPAALAQVSGGAAATAPPSGNDQVLTALTGILDTLKTLSTHQSNGGFNSQEMLMLMMIMQQRNQQVLVAPAGPSPWGQDPIIRYY